MATAHHADDHRAGRRSEAVGENYMRGLYGDDDYNATHYGHQQQQRPPPAPMAVAKALATATAAFSMLLLSGLAVTGTVLALIVATPLMVIFSPVLVPAAITVALLTVGIVSSGGFGVAAVAVLAWVYRYLQSSDHDLVVGSAAAHRQGLGAAAPSGADTRALK